MPPPGPISGPRPIPFSYLDTDGTLASNSDLKVASQKAVKTYVDAGDAATLTAADAYTDAAVLAIGVESGSYIPAIVDSINLDGDPVAVFETCYYSRIGNVVHVWGFVSDATTLPATATELSFSLPIVTTATVDSKIVGSGIRRSAITAASIENFGDGNARMMWTSTANPSEIWGFFIDYLIET